MNRRVVITGLGAVAPVGIGVKAFWHALRDGLPGIDTVSLFDASPYYCQVAAEVRRFEPRQFMAPKRAATIGRFAQLGVAAARMAFEDAALPSFPNAHRFAVCFGSAANAVWEIQHGIEQFAQGGVRYVAPSAMEESAGHALTAHVSAELGMRGQTMTLASGCCTGLDVIQWAYHHVVSGGAPAVLAGAAEAPLSTYTQAACCQLGVLSHWPGPPPQALRPFDACADGIVLGEGAGAFVLEELDHARGRGARIYAEVLGFGGGSEGNPARSCDPAGVPLQGALRAALRMARLDPTEIDYVSAHGNGLPSYDRAETVAYRAVFGRHAYSIPVSSIKPMTGQALGASGALQAVAACFTLEEQFVPPTLNHDIPAADCDLDYVPSRGRPARVNHLLTVAHAMGGTYSTLVLASAPDR